MSATLLAALLLVFAVALVASFALEDSVDEGGEAFRAVIGIAFLVTAAGTTITSAIAIIRDRERSLVSVFALVLGLVAAAFALGDQL